MTQGTTYSSAGEYIMEAQGNAREQIKRIDQIINRLLLLQYENAGKGNLKEYEVNDGQTKIRTVYQSAEDVAQAIRRFRALKVDIMYDSGLLSRVTRSVDAGSI